MARIRLPDVTSLGPRPTPASGYRPQAVRGAELVSEATTRLGSKITEVAETMQRKNDLADAQRAMAELNDFASDALFNPENGALSRRGRDAQNVGQQFTTAFEQRRNEIRNRLSRTSREAFDLDAMQRRTSFEQTLAQHTMREMQSYQAEDHKAFLQSEINGAVSAYESDDIAAGATARMRDAITAQVRSEGLSDNVALQRIEAAESAMDLARVRRALRAGDTRAAQRLAAQGRLRGDDLVAAETELRPAMELQMAEDLVMGRAENMRLPRSVRNNNPLNIRRTATMWEGEVVGADTDFKTFETPEAGAAAAKRLLLEYQERYGLNTVSGIINRWAPPSENDTGAYAATVARDLGVGVNDPIDLRDAATLNRMFASMARVEGGPAATQAEAPLATRDTNAMSESEFLEYVRQSGAPRRVQQLAIQQRREARTAANAERQAQEREAKNTFWQHVFNGTLDTPEGQVAKAQLYAADPEALVKALDSATVTDPVQYQQTRADILRGAPADPTDLALQLSRSDRKALIDLQLEVQNKGAAPFASNEDIVRSSFMAAMNIGRPADLTNPATAARYMAFQRRVETEVRAAQAQNKPVDMREITDRLLLETRLPGRFFDGAATPAFEAPLDEMSRRTVADIPRGAYRVNTPQGQIEATYEQLISVLQKRAAARGLPGTTDNIRAEYDAAVERGEILSVR